ncbi:MAG: phosphotransferase [Ilumatobacteraceae bacterium]|nr:phosphotransferase [Ilumatobacteraceae bacterium]
MLAQSARVALWPVWYEESMTDKPDVPISEVERFLVAQHGGPIESLAPLPGGFWSAAYGYRVGGQDLVLRLGTIADGFDADRVAMAFNGPDLPVPTIIAIGKAFDVGYAISERHYGRFLEDVRAEESPRSAPMVSRLLRALRTVEERPDLSVLGQPASLAPQDTWRNHLHQQLVDDGASRTAGWRSALRKDLQLDRLFSACEHRIEGLLDACVERRHVVHGDLLYQNVLISEDASTVTGVFSWKHSMRGDFLWDTAYCTFFSSWYPGVAAADPWAATLATSTDEQRCDAAARHHCYELTIGARRLGDYLVTNDEQNLQTGQRRLAEILERGRLPESPRR